MPMLAPGARSGSLRTIVCSGSPSHAWRTIADSVLPSRASTFSVCANSGSTTRRRLSEGAWPPGAAFASGRCRADQHDELIGVVAVGLDLVVRAATAGAPERDQELCEQRHRMGF